MFGKKNEVINISSDKVDTIIGRNNTIKGSIKATGVLRIDGNVDGEVESIGDVVIGESGKVEGNISAKHVTIAGIVEGNIKADANLEILSAGKLIGDIVVGKLIINDGAKFDGKCEMIKLKEEEKNGFRNFKKPNSEPQE